LIAVSEPGHSAVALSLLCDQIFGLEGFMPYRSNIDLPLPVQKHLPPAAQSIYREAFNHAWQTYQSDPRHEEIAHRVAWAAVKKSYRKRGDVWVPKQEAAVLRHRPVVAGCFRR
jgi:cation transport regulator